MKNQQTHSVLFRGGLGAANSKDFSKKVYVNELQALGIAAGSINF